LPQRPQFESFLEASAIAFLPTLMSMEFIPFFDVFYRPQL
jgi:hypothetical protein